MENVVKTRRKKARKIVGPRMVNSAQSPSATHLNYVTSLVDIIDSNGPLVDLRTFVTSTLRKCLTSRPKIV